MGLEEIKNDAKFNRQRIAGLDLEKLDRAKLVDFVKMELAENVYPFLEAFAEAVQKDLGALEETVGEIDEAVDALEADGDEDALHPETAQQILGVLQLGRAITVAVTPFLTKGVQITDDKRKRLKNMITAFRQGVEVVAEIVVAITMKPEPEDPADADAADGEAANDESAPDGDDADADGDEEGDDAEGDDDGFDAPGEEG